MTNNRYPDDSDTVELSSDDMSDVGEVQPVGQEKPQADAASELRAKLEAAREESLRWRDKFLRKAAELENFRKRIEREKRDWNQEATAAAVREFLPIMDACERALKSFEDAPDTQRGLEQYQQGVELLYKQLSNALGRLGVVRIEAEGREFDPHLHEALTHMESAEHDENTVISELTRGYLLHDRLLRPAQVVVAARPKPDRTDGR
jgi:molecular chaperone GrpE